MRRVGDIHLGLFIELGISLIWPLTTTAKDEGEAKQSLLKRKPFA